MSSWLTMEMRMEQTQHNACRYFSSLTVSFNELFSSLSLCLPFLAFFLRRRRRRRLRASTMKENVCVSLQARRRRRKKDRLDEEVTEYERVGRKQEKEKEKARLICQVVSASGKPFPYLLAR